jgi:hypothetical protein
MDPAKKPGRLYVEIQRGRNFAPLDDDGLADSYASLRINDGEPKRSSTIKSLAPVWNEQIQLECTRGDTLHVDVYDDDSMRKVKSAEYSELQGRASLRVGDLRVGEHATRVLKLTGGPGTPTLTLTLFWRVQEAATFASHEAQLRKSLSQMRHELALAQAHKASWENSSGYLRSFGVLAPAEARTATLKGIATAEVFPNARPPADKPRREGRIPVEQMVPRPEVLAAVAKQYGHKDFQVIAQTHATGGVDVVVGPRRQAESYASFQEQWKVRRADACRAPVRKARARGAAAAARAPGEGLRGLAQRSALTRSSARPFPRSRCSAGS